MAKPDEDDLLQVDQQPWVRREPSMSGRLIGLATALALGSHTRAGIQADWHIRPEFPRTQIFCQQQAYAYRWALSCPKSNACCATIKAPCFASIRRTNHIGLFATLACIAH
jgi:hypothetical protein